MDFALTEEQKMMQQMVHKFAQEQIAPLDKQMDENNEIDRDILTKMAKLDLWGLVGHEKYGGAGADSVCGAIVTEEIAQASGSIALTYDAHNLCLEGIQEFGTQEQKDKFLTKLCSGESLGAFSWTEPAAGSDAAGVETKAVLQGEEYVLNGVKCFVTNGDLADVFIVGAITDEENPRAKFSTFILEKGMQGFKSGTKEDKMGLRGSHTTELILDGVRVPKENLLGEEGQGFKIAMSVLNGGRISLGAISIGTAVAAMQAARDYAKKRSAFGKLLCEQQAVSFMLADMDTSISASRLLVYYAAWLKDQGQPYHKQAAQAKCFASEAAMQICKDAIQIHGGYGYTKDFPVERYFRNAKLNEIGEGASEVLRLLIARSILK